MPTYDYQCRSCGFITEVVHSMLDEGPADCERCGGQLRRVIHPTGIIFKGGGFYTTDSRSSTSAGAPSATSATDGAAKEKGSTAAPGSGAGKSDGGGD